MRITILGSRIVIKIQSRSDDLVIWSLTQLWATIAASLLLHRYGPSVILSLLRCCYFFMVFLMMASLYFFFACFWLLPDHPSYATHSSFATHPQRPSVLSLCPTFRISRRGNVLYAVHPCYPSWTQPLCPAIPRL